MGIFNAKDRLLSQNPGTLPDVSGSLFNWLQPITFMRFRTDIINFQADRTATEVSTYAVIQPFTAQKLQLRPEGERGWKWFTFHCLAGTALEVGDDITIPDVVNGNTSYRVMGKKDWTGYGYTEYETVQDYTESA